MTSYVKKIINTTGAPAAIGTYSQAVRVGETVYISGQIALDPVSKNLISEEFRSQVFQVMDNLSAICTAAGGSLADVVKLTIYLIDLSQYAIVNEVMARYFNETYPARAVVEVSALPKNACIEADAIMVLHQMVDA